MVFANEPTITPAPGFSSASDAETLRGAMKGLGTDEGTLLSLLTKRSAKQRSEIARAYSELFQRDLLEDVKSEVGGHFERVLVALLTPPTEFLCRELRNAMQGMGTDEHTLVEILCTRDRDSISEIVHTYEELFGRPLAEDLCSETSGDFRRLLTLIVTGERGDDAAADAGRARDIAEKLYEAGEGSWGTDEDVFCRVLARESFAQLRLVFEEYKSISGRTIEQAIQAELGGQLLEAASAVVECVQSTEAWFAGRVHAAMAGLGTDDSALIRILVSRSEIDLGAIKREYERLYDRTLAGDVAESETSGDYKSVLLAILGEQ